MTVSQRAQFSVTVRLSIYSMQRIIIQIQANKTMQLNNLQITYDCEYQVKRTVLRAWPNVPPNTPVGTY